MTVPVRCAALYRVSTTKQVHRDVDTAETLPMQRQAIRSFLLRTHPDWELVTEFTEEGVSAFRTAAADRDVLSRVFATAAQGQFTVLLVFKADRLSRQALEYPVILSRLHRCGVQVVATDDAPGGKLLEVDGQYEKLIRFVEGWQAETESHNTSIRVRTAMEQMARRGAWTGGTPPYGFRYTPTHAGPMPLEVHPDEADVVRRMFAWYLQEALGGTLIAQRLNRAGVRPRHGSSWSDWQVRRIMANPAVTGRFAYGRKKLNAAGHRSLRSRHDGDGVILGPQHENLVIVPIEEWEAAQQRMSSYNQQTGRRRTHAEQGRLLFTGFAHCSVCGGPLVSSGTGAANGGRLKYVCLNRRSRGAGACSGQASFSQRKVEQAVLPAILRTLQQMPTHDVVQAARHLAAQALFQQRSRATHVPAQLADAERVRSAWLTRLDGYFSDPATSLYTEDVLAEKVRDAEARCRRLRDQLADLSAAESQADAQLADLERFLASSQNWWGRFLDLPRAQQKQMLRDVIDRITVHRGGFHVYYRLDIARLGTAHPVSPITWREERTWQSI